MPTDPESRWHSLRSSPRARTLHERAPLFHAKCPSRSGNVPAPSCTPPHPFAEAPPVPPETGAMPPPDITHVPAQHYSCFPPTLLMFPLRHYSCFPSTLLMFPLNITHVYPRHYSCFPPARPPLPADLADCPGISAPRPPRPPEPSLVSEIAARTPLRIWMRIGDRFRRGGLYAGLALSCRNMPFFRMNDLDPSGVPISRTCLREDSGTLYFFAKPLTLGGLRAWALWFHSICRT